MQHIIYLILRKMRTPLILLICAYAISVLGFVLIPGQDDQGNPWDMSFFHAFYFVSFMGSTIGFGEIPYPFTDAQRLWTLFTIYATVISWLYAIGTLIALLQTPLFQAAVIRNSFVRRVRKINQPFYVICGYGDTGQLIVNALTFQEINCVVIDKNPNRINELDLEDLPREVPRLNGDAADSETLSRAGITNKFCEGVVAVTRDNEVNLKVAIVSKLLNPKAKVFCWSETHDAGANMASFGTDHIINPYDTFGNYLSSALTSPNRHLLHLWLTASHHAPLYQPVYPPKGRWILCGYGRFGKAVYKKLLAQGLPVTVIEIDPESTNPPEEFIKGRGTEAETLQAAQIHKAVGIIAGTDHDVNNLSILITARELNPKLFTIARQESSSNTEIFEAAKLNLITNNSSLIASQLLAKITTPLTASFLNQIKEQNDEWAKALVNKLKPCVTTKNPHSWVITLNYKSTAGFIETFNCGEDIYLKHLLANPVERDLQLPCIALLIHRDGKDILLPDEDTLIYPHDQILFAGDIQAKAKIRKTVKSPEAIHYITTGNHLPSSHFWRWVSAHFLSKKA